MVDKAIQPEALLLNDSVPPFDIVEGYYGVDQLMLFRVHIVFLSLIQGLGNGIRCVGRCNYRRQYIILAAYNLTCIQPANELLFPICVFQPFNLLRNLGCVCRDGRLHSCQLILCHTVNDSAHIIVDLRCCISIVPIDLSA